MWFYTFSLVPPIDLLLVVDYSQKGRCERGKNKDKG
jgi:hypothetical protein